MSTANGDVQWRAYLLAAGSNSDGQLGIGCSDDARCLRRCVGGAEAPFPPLGWRVVHLASGAGHAVAIVERDCGDRQVWVSGTGAEGQLGPAYSGARNAVAFEKLDCDAVLLAANAVDDTVPPRWRAKQVACGWNWTLLSFESSEDDDADDILLVLGSTNDFGQLGRGADRNYRVPVGKVDLAAGETSDRMRVETMACGMRHSLVLCSYGARQSRRHTLYGWGAARHGQVGAMSSSSTTDAAPRHPAASKSASIMCTPRPIQTWKRLTCDGKDDDEACQSFFVSAGKQHSALWVPRGWQAEESNSGLLSNADEHGRLLVFGCNRMGQTDLQRVAFNTHTRMLRVDCTWTGTLAFWAESGRLTVQGSGSNAKGQMGVGSNVETSKPLSWQVEAHSTRSNLACGSEHVVVLLHAATATQLNNANARVLGWGWNEHGNLARGDDIDRFEPVQLWPTQALRDDLPHQATPTHVWAGCGTTFIQVMS